MTIKELKMMFTEETKIEIMAFDEDNSVSVGLTRLLLGLTSLAEIPIAIKMHRQSEKIKLWQK